jgi:flagellar biosynthesis chaperone FliJ
MSRAMTAMARLAKVRQDMAMAKARRIASEFAKAKDLNEQVVQYAGEYGDAAMQIGQQGISVALLNDTMAFRAKLLAGAKEQELATAHLYRQLQEANKVALSAKMKSQGLDRAVARRKKVAEQEEQQAEWQEIEDAFSHRKSPFSEKPPRD